MAAFKYIGEAPDGPFTMYGATWDVGTTAEVTDPVYAGKLRGNRFFEEVAADTTAKGRKAGKAKVVTDGNEEPSQPE